MKKIYRNSIVVAGMALLLMTAAITLTYSPASKADKEQAIAKAKEAFSELKAEGVDLSAGPCIAEDLMPDWVADIAHNPRQAVDDQTDNQCQAYRTGKARHFVELDPNGNVIQAR